MNYKCKAFRNGTKIYGQYANHLNLGQNTFQFLLCAGHFYPANEQAQLHTRIVTSATRATAILEIIQKDSILHINSKVLYTFLKKQTNLCASTFHCSFKSVNEQMKDTKKIHLSV